MARAKTPDPTEQLDALDAERVKLAGERHTLDAERRRAEDELALIPEHRREALVVQARGGEPEHDPQQLAVEAAQLQQTVADASARIDVLAEAERRNGRDAQIVVEENIPYFETLAIAKTERTVELAAEANAALGTWNNAKRQA